MNWYVAKIIYQIICGEGRHTPQFDEQVRLITAADEADALEKAHRIGHAEAEVFCNDKAELVQWRFINVPELYCLQQMIDGAEIWSRIAEVDDAAHYISLVNKKADSLQEGTTHRLLNLI